MIYIYDYILLKPTHSHSRWKLCQFSISVRILIFLYYVCFVDILNMFSFQYTVKVILISSCSSIIQLIGFWLFTLGTMLFGLISPWLQLWKFAYKHIIKRLHYIFIISVYTLKIICHFSNYSIITSHHFNYSFIYGLMKCKIKEFHGSKNVTYYLLLLFYR